MEIVKKKIKDIHPYENNPRKNDSAVAAVVESIKQCGYIAPIIVDENGTILAGHTRYKALRKLRISECDVAVASGLSEEQKRKYRLLDNKTNELAEWDFGLLKGELSDLDFGDLDIDWGVPESNDQFDVSEDDYDVEPPKEPKSKIGQVYKLGRHRLMCGDSTSPDDVHLLVGGHKWTCSLPIPHMVLSILGKPKMR